MKPAMNVAITGAAGQIGYTNSRSASPPVRDARQADQPVILQLLEITPGAAGALQGVVMELKDCAFPTLERRRSPPTTLRRGVQEDRHAAMLVGARPRGPGMERKDLLDSPMPQIFSAQGKALNDHASQAACKRAGGRQPGQHQRADRDEATRRRLESRRTSLP